MAHSHSDREHDFVKTQLVVFYVILLLAVDSINPVKLFLHVFPRVAPWHVASISILLMIYVFISEMKQLLYFSVKIFFNSILSIFFREVSIIGSQNIPVYGPVIFTSNHANQFIDSVVILSTCQRTVSYLIAEKSWKRRIVGDIAWAMGAVPIRRAQDTAKAGSGSIKLEKVSNCVQGKNGLQATTLVQVIGDDTKFLSEINVADKIRVNGVPNNMKVVHIENDASMTVDGIDLLRETDLSSSFLTFDILKRMDQKAVYEMVLSKLASGGAIAIFPEGGSHDRTDLLPLKVGVSLISYSAMEDGLNVPIVPVGLNYFRGHRFRGRVIVEFGRPTYVDPNTLVDYQKGGLTKRKVCTQLLEKVEDSMRGVIVSCPDYESLQMIHTARRLYRSKFSTDSEKQDLSRRFAEGYKRLLLVTKGNPPAKWLDLQNRINRYQKDLNELGIRDYQVHGLVSEQNETDGDTVLREMRLPFRIAELILLSLLALVPTLFLNLPVGLIAKLYANRRRKKALAASKVKVKGMDVLLSEKVLLCIVLVPSLWLLYGLALFHFTDLDESAIALVIFSLPLFSYMGIVTAEAGMVDLKDLKPHLMRLYPSTRSRHLALPSVRLELQNDLRKFIKTIGPSFLGDIYTEKELDWALFQHSSRNKQNSKYD